MARVCNLCGSAQVSVGLSLYDVADPKNPTCYDLLHCTNCGFVFLDPDAVRKDYDYYGDTYYSYMPLSQKEMSNLKRRATNAAATLRILDVGCGSGKWLYERQLEGHEVCGIETDPRAVRAARAVGLNVVSDTDDLPECAFDCVRLSHVLEHTDDPTSMLARLYGKLRPGGKIEILVPNLDSVKFELIPEVSKLVDVPRHLVFFTERTLGRVLGQTGFVEVSTACCATPNDLRELLGDIRRLRLYHKKVTPGVTNTLRLFSRILYIRLKPSSRAGKRNDWIRAEARRPQNSL